MLFNYALHLKRILDLNRAHENSMYGWHVDCGCVDYGKIHHTVLTNFKKKVPEKSWKIVSEKGYEPWLLPCIISCGCTRAIQGKTGDAVSFHVNYFFFIGDGQVPIQHSSLEAVLHSVVLFVDNPLIRSEQYKIKYSSTLGGFARASIVKKSRPVRDACSHRKSDCDLRNLQHSWFWIRPLWITAPAP